MQITAKFFSTYLHSILFDHQTRRYNYAGDSQFAGDEYHSKLEGIPAFSNIIHRLQKT